MNLRLRTDNTFLSSTITVNSAIRMSFEASFNEVAICDLNNMFGVAEFYFLCKKNNLKPIIGVEFSIYFSDEIIANVLLFAMNETGYYNLVNLTSLVNRFDTKALTLKELSQFHQGIIAVIPSDNTYLNMLVENNQIFEINECIASFKNIYQYVYFGVYRYRNCNKDSIQLLKDLFINQQVLSIAMQTVFHKDSDDTLILNLLDCIKENKKANKDFLKQSDIADAYFKNMNELKIMYDQDELNNLRQMLNLINVEIKPVEFGLPKPYDSDTNPIELIKNTCMNRLKGLYLENNKTYMERLQMELNVITKMGFVDYFLIVADYVNYAKTHDIMVGPGRGSAASSLVAYLLNITTIDPIKNNLIFERFLNPSRITMPDIDIDFVDIKRDNVIQYLKDKYGYSCVSNIVTFSTLGAKSAIRDVARIMQYSNEDVDYLLSFYPKTFKSDDESAWSLKKAYKEDAQFKEIVDRHQKYKQLVSLASKIEGLKRQSGIHAAGVVLYHQPLSKYIPTMEVEKNTLVTQYDYENIEKLGLIKMDILSLKNLTIIDFCFKSINEMYHSSLNIDNFSFDFPDVYNFLATGNTIGLFQLEGKGMKKTLQQLKPTCFEDVVNLIALYRPGPMQNIDSFIKRKHNLEPVNYYHDDLKDILKSTYGIIIYQEQIMQIAKKIANYSLAEADLLRRAISKKNTDKMDVQQNIFIDRSVINGYGKELATNLFLTIQRFAKYGYNKAHSVAYATITVTMAALKYKYPAIFYATLLNLIGDSDEQKNAIFKEAKYFNISILSPHINESYYSFALKDNNLMFGLGNIKTLKNQIAIDILNERKKGQFVDIYDFMIRMLKINVSMNNMEALIYSGALDCFNISRECLISNLVTLYEYGKMFIDLDYQVNDYHKYDYIPCPILVNKPSDIDLLLKEKEFLGLYLSKHPLTTLKEKYQTKITDIGNILDKEYNTYLLGKINQIELSKNKNGKNMLRVILEDETATIRLFAYDNQALMLKEKFHKHETVIVYAHVKNKEIAYINKMDLIGG